MCLGRGLRVSLGICEQMCWDVWVPMPLGEFVVAVPQHHVYIHEEIFMLVCGYVLYAYISEPAIF